MLHRKIINAIYKINPNAQFGLSGDSWEEITFEWTNGTTPISKSEIEAMIPIVEQEIANEQANAIAKKEEAEAIMEQLGLTKEHLKALGL